MYTPTSSPNDSDSVLETSARSTNIGEEEQGLVGGTSTRIALPLSVRSASTPEGDEETELRTRRTSMSSVTSAIKKKSSQIYDAVVSSSQRTGPTPMEPSLVALVDAYADSDIAKDIKADVEQIRVTENAPEGSETRDVVEETVMVRGRKRATWGTQFRILSGRAFKNLYRDPALLAAHYISSIVLACE